MATYFFYNAEKIANQIIRNELIKKYNESNESLYLISIDDIHLNVFSGTVELERIHFVPKDSLVILKRDADGMSIENTFFNMEIEEVALDHFDIMLALNEHKIKANSFEIHNPVMDIYHYDYLSVPEGETQDTVDFRSIFLDNYDSFDLGKLGLEKIQLSYNIIDSLNDTAEIFRVKNVNYEMYGVNANKSTLYSNKYLNVDRYLLDSEDIIILLQDDASLSVGAVNYDSDDNQLIVAQVGFEPGNTPEQFFKEQEYRKGWKDFSLDSLKIKDIDFIKWLNHEQMFAKSVSLIHPQLKVHSNLKKPHSPNVIKPMLGEMILAVPYPIHIEKAAIKNAEIFIDLLGNQTPVHGKLNFTEMNILATNITNIPNKIEEHSILNIDAKTKINGTGNILSNIKVHMDSPSSKTQFTVNASNLDLVKFNDVLKPIIRVSTDAGEIIDLKIASTLSNNGAIGTMDAHYKGLKIKLESKDLNSKPGFFNNVASGLANGILKTENIPGSPYYHQGKFQITKKPFQNFFTMLWMVTFHGLEDSILGSNSKDERTQRKKEKKSQPKKKLFNFK